eukprot:TRINITY_DN1819_c1_g1_i2.p1 TRINITY_DN1819_c1_g1~~TRINITY_DN1819_c1_g1_i2.p1  ORF type:complete len:589 (+),score=137.96 TRINITY_DN1819_c1_g1_i2:347-2113(+)
MGWEIPCTLVIPRKDEEEIFGLAFQGRNKMVLKRLIEGSASAAAGGTAFIGRRLTHANGKVNAKCDDIARYTGLRLELRWAYPVGYPLKVQRRNGVWASCAVRALDDKRYIVTGKDEDGVYDKVVPFEAADRLLVVDSPANMYTVDQRVQVKIGGRYANGVVNKVEKSSYNVVGETEDWEKDIKHEDAVTEMRPSAPFPYVEFTDAVTGKKIKFMGVAGGKLGCFINGIQQRKPVEKIKYQPKLEGDQILVAGYLSAPITLPLGDNYVVSDLRILCNEFKVKHNITDDDLFFKTVYPYDEEPDVLGMFQELEATDRNRLQDLEKKAHRYLETLQRRLKRNYYGNAASTGLRIAKDGPVTVAGVPNGTAAQRAGFKQGDVITKVITANGTWKVYDRQQFITAVGPKGAVFGGSEVIVEVSRSTETKEAWAKALKNVVLPAVAIPADNPLPDMVLPEPKEVSLLKLRCETSLSFRNKLLAALIPLQHYYIEIELELIADVMANAMRCMTFTEECAKETLPNYIKGIDRDDLEQLHYRMMDKLGLEPISAHKIDNAFNEATAHFNAYRLDFNTTNAVLRDLLFEVFCINLT